MGYSCSKDNVMLFLTALENILQSQGYALPEHGIIAAQEVYHREINQ
jgi:hypothetical protein